VGAFRFWEGGAGGAFEPSNAVRSITKRFIVSRRRVEVEG
jgi:hypothetical protein